MVAQARCSRVGRMTRESTDSIFDTSYRLWANVADATARTKVEIWSANAASRDTD